MCDCETKTNNLADLLEEMIEWQRHYAWWAMSENNGEVADRAAKKAAALARAIHELKEVSECK